MGDYMTLVRAALTLVLTLLLAVPVDAQGPSAGPARPTRMVIASTRLPSVVDTPLHFRLLRVSIPAGQAGAYAGPNGMLYVLSGTLAVALDGDHRALHEGSATFLPAGRRVTLTAAAGVPAVALHFVLGTAAEVDQAGHGRPATATELYHSREPLPALKPGPHEFTMTRVAVEKGVPRPPMHSRSGAALYYVLAGNWTIHLEGGRSEPRSRGNIQLEPNGFIHTWENVGEGTGILLQANISAEGTPEIMFLPSR
jgi:quercetin dioxygenase-like cupin family protein